MENAIKLAAIIPCGGRSERMKDALNGVPSKLFLPTKDGTPVIVLSVRAMLAAVDNGPIILAVPSGTENDFRLLLKNNISPQQFEQLRFVAGGSTRQVSVHNGLELIATEFIGNEPEWVLIHDGARPFVESSDVSSLLNEGKRVARASVAMTLATRVTNTIKRARLAAKGGAIVVETPPRSELWEVQTPQLFSFQLILRAHRQLAGGDAEFTDDCQLVEAVGGEVRLIEGSRANIKVTAPGDL